MATSLFYHALASCVQKLYGTAMGDAHIIEGLQALAVPLLSLRPNPDTATQHLAAAIQEIQESVAMFRQYRPVLARTSNRVIIVGTGLFLAMQCAGYHSIACVFIDVDEETAAAIMLTDGKSARHCRLSSERVEKLHNIATVKYLKIPGILTYEMDGLSSDVKRRETSPSGGTYTSWMPSRFKR